jgi:poly(3-hydroxyalkanoate) synthetase
MYPEKQSFKRSHVIVDTPTYAFHKFHDDNASGAPIFVVGPHAGRHVNIIQRLVDTCVAEGRPVYSYELKSANDENKSTTIEDLVQILYDCVTLIGEPVDLIGVCQGAWLGGLFAARFPDLVTKYANIVGPINTRTGQDNAIEKYMKHPGIVEYHQKKFDANGGIQKGDDQWFAFSMLDPWETYLGRFFTQQQNLFFGLFTDKSKAIEKWEHNNSWHDDQQDLGAWFMEVMKWHFKDNRIYEGTFPKILGEDVNFKNITCPVFLFAGGTDNITSTRQVLDMANIVGSTEIHSVIFEKDGHTNAFNREKSLKIFRKMFFENKTFEVATDETEREMEEATATA